MLFTASAPTLICCCFCVSTLSPSRCTSSNACRRGSPNGPTSSTCALEDWSYQSSEICDQNSQVEKAGVAGMVLSGMAVLVGLCLYAFSAWWTPKLGARLSTPSYRDCSTAVMRSIPLAIGLLAWLLTLIGMAVDEWSKASFRPIPWIEFVYHFGVLKLRMSSPQMSTEDHSMSYRELCAQSDMEGSIKSGACAQMRAGGIVAMIAGIVTLILQCISIFFMVLIILRASRLPLYVVRLWRLAGMQLLCLVLALAQWLFGGQLVWDHEAGDFLSVHLGASWGLLCTAMVLQWIAVFWWRQSVMCTAPADVNAAAAGGEALPPHVQYAAPLAAGSVPGQQMPPFAYPVVQASPYAPSAYAQGQPAYIPPTAGYMPPPQQNPNAYAPLQQ